MPPLWVYKCNAKNGPHQTSWGDWSYVFDRNRPTAWGGTRHTSSWASLKIIRERLQVGDWVLAYQTDLPGAVGLCEITKLPRRGEDEVEIHLKPLECFARPVNILAFKRNDREVAAIRAFRQGQVQSIYETSPAEADLLLRLCGLRLRAKQARPDKPKVSQTRKPSRLKRASTNEGAGFGDPETNKKVERAAIRAVRADFEERGFEVRSFERDKVGFDLKCTSNKIVFHVEVKGVSGDREDFILTAREFELAESDPEFRLAVVLRALSKSRQIRIYSGQQFERNFTAEPLQYRCRRIDDSHDRSSTHD